MDDRSIGNSGINGNNEGGYVFISHAHKDIREIRGIRNFLENNGLEPICFFLKCLSDDDEILDLIKREIDAREWFLYVDSDNARESKWVRTEVEYIQTKDSKKMVSVSLNEREGIIPALTRLCKCMKVFLSYSRRDQYIAQAIYNECLKHDFKPIYGLESVNEEDIFERTTGDAISRASKKGCVVVIISKDSVRSNWNTQEMLFAESDGAYILPVIVDDVDLPPEYYMLTNYQAYRLKTPVSNEQIAEIVSRIEKLSIRRLMEDMGE